MKILVVDDNQMIINVIKLMLNDDNHDVKTATNGDDGYSTYLDFKPEVVITDIQLPAKNGFEMMETIRSHNPAVKTIYMSGNPGIHSSQLEQEITRYAVTVLSKPFPMEELVQTLSAVSTLQTPDYPLQSGKIGIQ